MGDCRCTWDRTCEPCQEREYRRYLLTLDHNEALRMNENAALWQHGPTPSLPHPTDLQADEFNERRATQMARDYEEQERRCWET